MSVYKVIMLCIFVYFVSSVIIAGVKEFINQHKKESSNEVISEEG